MINQRRIFMLGIGLILLAIILSLTYPFSRPLGEELGLRLGMPVYSNMELKSGFHYVGIISTILLISGLYVVGFATKQGKKRYVIPLVVLGVLYVPSFLITGYQKTFASGVYALDLEQTQCEYMKASEEVMDIECMITLRNYSNEIVDGEIFFVEHPYWEEPFSIFALLNQERPHLFSIDPNRTEVISFKISSDISNVKSYAEGHASIFNIGVVIDHKQRILTPIK